MFGSFGRGWSQALGGYIQQERQRNRDAEDKELDMQMKLIEQMSSRPDFNPEQLGRAIDSLHMLAGMKGGRNRGPASITGQHEPVMAPFLQAIADRHGNISGPTFEDQTRSGGAFPMTAQGGMSPTQLPGQVSPHETPIDAAPLPMPPSGTMASTHTQRVTLPADQQPIFRSPQEMGSIQGEVQGGVELAKKKSDWGALNWEADQLGLTGEQRQQWLMTRGQSGHLTKGSSQEFVLPDGTHVMATEHMDTRTGASNWVTQAGGQLPPGATPVGKAASMRPWTDEHGGLWNLSGGIATPIAGPNGQLKGHQVGDRPFFKDVTQTNPDGSTVQGGMLIWPDGRKMMISADPSAASQPSSLPSPPGSSANAPTSSPAPLPAPPGQGAQAAPAAPAGAAWDQAKASEQPPQDVNQPWHMPDKRVARYINGEWRAPKAGAQGLPAAPGAQAAPGDANVGFDPKAGPASAAVANAKPISFSFGKPPKLNADQQKTIDTSLGAVSMIRDVEKSIFKAFGDPKGGPTTLANPRDYPDDTRQQLSDIKDTVRYSMLHRLPTQDYISEVKPLADFLKVFGAGPYLHGMRNMHYVEQIQRHLPDVELPIPDTPAMLILKLNRIKANINGIMHVYGKPAPFPEAPTAPAYYQEEFSDQPPQQRQ